MITYNYPSESSVTTSVNEKISPFTYMKYYWAIRGTVLRNLRYYQDGFVIIAYERSACGN